MAADDICWVVATHGDSVYELVLRAGCPADRASDVLLAAVGQLLDALADDPAGPTDLLGCWLGAAHALAGPGAQFAALRDAENRDDDGIAVQVHAANAALDPGSARLLFLRDTCDLPPASVAVALGLGMTELRRRTGTARLAFLHAYDPAATRLLNDLPACAADLGELAALCDATAAPRVSAELRRHAYRCQRCEETTELQYRARRILRRVATRPMEPPARVALVAAAGRLAEARLSVLDAMLDAAGAPETGRHGGQRPRVRPAVIAGTLVAALLTGSAAGVAVAILDDGSSHQRVSVHAPAVLEAPMVVVSPPAAPRTRGAAAQQP